MMNGHDATRARDALFSLDAGCPRSEWVSAGMAAKAAGLSEADFLEWSATGANFGGERDARSAWKSFKQDGGIGPATLFRMAMDAGWRDSHPRNVTPAARVPVARPTNVDAPRKPRTDLAATFDSYPCASADHPYIVAKRGTPDGLRVVPKDDTLTIGGQHVAGWLAVPVRSFDGMLCTVQFVPPPGAGKKLNAPGASFNDGLFMVGDITPDGTLYVCEGIGQAWACAKADYHAAAAVTFGSGRTRSIAKVLRKRFPAARIVIVPDRGKEADAEAIARELTGAWVELPSDKPANYDANDYEAQHGIDALADLLRAAKTPPLRYRLQSADDLLTAPPLRWMVQGVLPASGFAAVYGPSGSGKSFLVLDLCTAIAAGAAWFGRRANAAPVTYVCLEGEAGLSKRARAWSAHRGMPLPNHLHFVTQSLDLRQPDDVADLCTAVLAASGRDGLLVIDTLNRAAPGTDENSSVDMGHLIEACKEAQRRLGGVVLLVHHTGKDGTKGLRGHSSLYAALDAAIEVSRNDGRREWSVAKSKDDADGGRHGFALRIVELGDDEHGEPVTSCVVEADDSAKEVARVRLPQGGNQRIALDALAEPLRQSCDFGKGDAPPTHPCLEIEAAVRLVASSLTCESRKRNERARAAVTGLVANGIYGSKDGWLWRK
ncbi:AAA family ATPase [Burkholderia cenocepacia]|uniref:AAA family ATPase n=1 Tax=Burkholderia cenocepacia TaxID=95486 RepID=UPI001BACC8E6|nr:AAA family ATPase [Burkholderia cenocepacia]QUN44654.1 AAA family ATPase [Burkholderia cenocepacia]QUO23868.1 AAA family ATPase [Burkholderia cenocepacia]